MGERFSNYLLKKKTELLFSESEAVDRLRKETVIFCNKMTTGKIFIQLKFKVAFLEVLQEKVNRQFYSDLVFLTVSTYKGFFYLFKEKLIKDVN